MELGKETKLMGVLNVTPDSFSDGNLFLNPKRAIRQAMRMIQEGADIIDIGGESTRPGARPVSAREEMRRILPVIQHLKRTSSIPLSVDTTKPQVAEAALEEGADIINDITGLRHKKMAPLVSRYRAGVIVMHMKGSPQTMQRSPFYRRLIPEIKKSLQRGVQTALEAGISSRNILIDPGIGFGKTFQHNIEILRLLYSFQVLNQPILVGVSRKSFIGHYLGNVPPDQRLSGSLALAVISIMNGTHVLRVHDVKEHREVVKCIDPLLN